MDWYIIAIGFTGLLAAGFFIYYLVGIASGRIRRNPHDLTEDAYVSGLGRKHLDD